MLLGAALLIPGTAAAAFSSPKCGCSHTSTTSTSSTQTTSTETSDVSETTSTQSTETTETSDVSETTSTQSTETTETSDVSETTETSDVSDTTSTQGTTTTDETGGVGGETGTPEVTPPSTSSLPGSSGSSDGWRVILLALAGIAVLSLILLPGDRKRTPR